MCFLFCFPPQRMGTGSKAGPASVSAAAAAAAASGWLPEPAPAVPVVTVAFLFFRRFGCGSLLARRLVAFCGCPFSDTGCTCIQERFEGQQANMAVCVQAGRMQCCSCKIYSDIDRSC